MSWIDSESSEALYKYVVDTLPYLGPDQLWFIRRMLEAEYGADIEVIFEAAKRIAVEKPSVDSMNQVLAWREFMARLAELDEAA